MANFKLLECFDARGVGLEQIGREWFGEIASAKSLDSGALPRCPSDPLLRALAAEYLIAPEKSAIKPILREYLRPFETAGRPLRFFGLDEPRYSIEKLSQYAISCAVFPIATDKGNPQLGRIWCIQPTSSGAQQSDRFELGSLEGRETLLGLSEKLCFLADIPDEHKNVVGRSWLAAAHLAALSLPVEAETRLRLARDFLATAEVDPAGRLQSVVVGNKLAACRNNQNRVWLVAKGDADFQSALTRWDAGKPPQYYEVKTIDEAFGHVAGYAIRPGERRDWPKDIVDMHVLVGGSIAAGLVSVLLTRPHRLHLWHTHNDRESYEPACIMKSLLSRLGGLADTPIELHEVPSGDAALTEEAIRKTLNATPKSPVLFNVTSGNRLMMYAVDRISHDEHWAVRLIYRDIDAPGLDYTMIVHEGGVVKTHLCAPLLASFDAEALGGKLLKLIR